jgi:Cu-Zn family superoxide dismutase
MKATKEAPMRASTLALAAVLLGGPMAFAETGKAQIRGTTEGSSVTGEATVTPAGDGLAIAIRVSGAPPGAHGLHIHEFGLCGEAGKAAGGHYNPDGVKHGHLPKDGFAGAHAGDLGNIDIGADGTGSLDVTVPGLSLSGGNYSVAGRAIILHEKADDFGQPTGNAGGRIGCGPIVLAP